MPPPSAGRIQVTIPANVPFKQKWDLLKPVIEQLYVDENQALGEVVAIMKRDYGFAAESVLLISLVAQFATDLSISCSEQTTRLQVSFQDMEVEKEHIHI